MALAIFAGDIDVDADFGGDALDAVDLHGAEVGAVASVARFLSFRNVVFCVAFFGLAGSLLTLLGVGAIFTPAFAGV